MLIIMYTSLIMRLCSISYMANRQISGDVGQLDKQAI